MTTLLLASLLVMAASLAGVVAVWKRAGRILERNADFLVSFSAGVFLVVAYRLATEAVEHADSFGDGVLWVFLGALFTWVLFKLVPMLHSHHDDADEHEHAHEGLDQHDHSSLDIRRMLLGDGLHNIGDGLLLAASFAVSPALGIAAAASVFVHELIQGISEFFVLRSAGYSARQALTLNLIINSTILIGALGGYFLLDALEVLEVPLLGLAAGTFLVVVLHDLIPHSVKSSTEKLHYTKHMVWFLVGLAIMFGASAFISHEESADGAPVQQTQ